MNEKKGERLARDRFLAGLLNPDQRREEGLDDIVELPKPPASLVIECSDGRRRAVSFHTGTKLVGRSVVVPENGACVDKMELGDRQLKGLGVRADTRPGDFLTESPPMGDFL